jgi:hypothetical protein
MRAADGWWKCDGKETRTMWEVDDDDDDDHKVDAVAAAAG